jgi:CelD/BcsL family acetyltransferase involved in cellulose biosynthesis
MFDVSVLRSLDELERFEDSWNDALERSASRNVFMTWDWAVTWARHYAHDKALCLLRVAAGAEPIGVVPLYHDRLRRFGLGYRVLRLLGDGSWDSDYLDIVAARGHEEEAVRAMMSFATNGKRSFDLLQLNEVPESSPVAAHVGKVAKELDWHWQERRVPCAYVDLPADWDEFLKRLAPRMRTKIRSLGRSLEQRFTVRNERCEREADLVPRLDDLFRLHQMRWRERASEGVFASPAKQAFYRDMALRFLRRRQLAFYSLSVDDRFVAHQFCLEYDRRMFLLQEGFDPAFDEHGVGNVLRAHVFRDCIERGVATYDFLAGVTQHKRSWGGSVKHTLRITTGPRTARNAAFFYLPKVVGAMKPIVKPLLPARAVTWARGIAGL